MEIKRLKSKTSTRKKEYILIFSIIVVVLAMLISLNFDQRTILFLCIKNKLNIVVKDILKKNINTIELKDEENRYPIMVAAQYSNIEILNVIKKSWNKFEYKIQNSRSKKDGWRMLFRDRGFAARFEHVFEGASILDLAIQGKSYITGLERKNNEVIQEVLKIDLSEEILNNALDTTIIFNNKTVFYDILDKMKERKYETKIDVFYVFEENIGLKYPIIRDEMLEIIIKSDKKYIRQTDIEGKTILHKLLNYEKWYSFQNDIFTKNNISTEINKYFSMIGESYEDRLKVLEERERMKIISEILDNGGDVNKQSNDGMTPFHYFTSYIAYKEIIEEQKNLTNYEKEMINLFIKYGLDIAIKNKEGEVALDYLNESEKKEFYEIYMKKIR